MSFVLVMYTASDLDRIHGSPVISWLTAPTYALMVPENTQSLHPAPIDLLPYTVESHFAHENGDDGIALSTEPAGILPSSSGKGFISRAQFDRVHYENKGYVCQIQAYRQQIESLSREAQKWKNKSQQLQE